MKVKVMDAIKLLELLGFPKAQQNERSGFCLLALLDLREKDSWAFSKNPLSGITPIMKFVEKEYGKKYAPNTRETFRRQTMHQFVQAGIVQYNPDKPSRPVNSLSNRETYVKSYKNL